jgi:hypothetical protein
MKKSDYGCSIDGDGALVLKSTVLPPSQPDIGPAGDFKRDVSAKKKKIAQGKQRDSQDASFKNTTGGLALSKAIISHAAKILAGQGE